MPKLAWFDVILVGGALVAASELAERERHGVRVRSGERDSKMSRPGRKTFTT